MADNIQRSTGRSSNYKLDRGGAIADVGPFVGEIMNNIDPTFSGRVQVYIEAFGSGNKSDANSWRTVRYLSPFYGATDPRLENNYSAQPGAGTFLTNPHSYGWWMTPPDIGTQVLCFFIEGDPTLGYYIGCLPPQGLGHMVPAVGATDKFELDSQPAKTYLGSASTMSVVEYNLYNTENLQSTRFFDSVKPIHRYVAQALFQQGLSLDQQRGTISSSSQRESPSTVFGFSTPGRPIYNGGLLPADIKSRLQSGSLTPADVKVIARCGGHSMVMDDGDLEGRDNLVRIRSSNGHMIMMNDEANFFYIIHANGQTWIELGKEGTVDVFSTNSVNVRTKGTINLHADQDININAGKKLNIKAKTGIAIESDAAFTLKSIGDVTIYSQAKIGVRADGSLALKSEGGSWAAGGSLVQKAGRIDLNGGSTKDVAKPPNLTINTWTDIKFQDGKGWVEEPDAIKTIATRITTHEPYPYHNQGVPAPVKA